MRAIIILSLLCASFFANAQTQDSVKRTEEYVLVVGTQKFMSSKLSISLDYGQEQKLHFFSDPNKVKDADGKVASFNSVVDALNYMNSQGWIFVDAYPIYRENTGTVYNFLMKRSIK